MVTPCRLKEKDEEGVVREADEEEGEVSEVEKVVGARRFPTGIP